MRVVVVKKTKKLNFASVFFIMSEQKSGIYSYLAYVMNSHVVLLVWAEM